ncbi:MAG TPA: 2-C-methyl-D-erythritol 4-phosphate cytidylyltransferase [Smithellaceae bacterium]|nr:2-C-methyl-D-erythritol 4-phosphate cytidylyltransferase [Smithellaceae bacterium]
MKAAAIICAGGSGRRFGGDQAKQYRMLGERPVLAHTLGVFCAAPAVDQIIVVVPVADLDFVREKIVSFYGLNRIAAVVAGGERRQDSVYNGLQAVSRPCDFVIVHDGVRPLVTEAMIGRVLEAASTTGAACAGVRATDTIKKASADGRVEQTLPREALWLVQTPQAFSFDLLCRAHEQAARDDYTGTDDASLVEHAGGIVTMVEGAAFNIKITTPEDLAMAARRMTSERGDSRPIRAGFGYDSHRLVENRKLILGGVDIPFSRGLAGHSDADALVHAIGDALLGAAALGDIGRHFPDTDPAYANADSLVLLSRIKTLLDGAGLVVSHVDATVILEKPKLAPHADAMRANLARTLGIAVSRISIKAKTNEGMGFVGRGEGIAVFASATVAERITHGL